MPKFCVRGDSIGRGAFDTQMGGRTNRLHVEGLKSNSYVYNFSISSNDTNGVLMVMEQQFKILDTIESANEYVFIFAIGGNDARYINTKKNKVVVLDKFKNNLEKIISISKQYTTKIMFVGLNKVDESKTTPIPREPNEYYENNDLEIYDKMIQEICDKHNIGFISTFNLLNPKEFEDGLHPNAEGHQKIFETVKAYLLKHKIVKMSK